MTQAVIWWLDAAAQNAALALGTPASSWPSYVWSGFLVSLDRKHAEIVVPDGIDFEVPPDLKEKAARTIGDGFVGVVIRKTDISHVLPWPGFVTDGDLAPVVLTDVRY